MEQRAHETGQRGPAPRAAREFVAAAKRTAVDEGDFETELPARFPSALMVDPARQHLVGRAKSADHGAGAGRCNQADAAHVDRFGTA
jgi:hypothetical protein